MSDEVEQIGILKSAWKKREDGIWSIRDVKGLDLNPREGFTDDYFKIESTMEFLTPTPDQSVSGQYFALGTTEFFLRQSIVPIVAWKKGEAEIRTIGTGFFVSASGYLITAAHVLRDPIDEDYASVSELGTGQFKYEDGFAFGIVLPGNPVMRNAPVAMPDALREANFFLCPFEWTSHWGEQVDSPLVHKEPEFRLNSDVGICKVQEQPLLGPFQPLNVGLHGLNVGDRAVAIGYAEMKNIPVNGENYQPELVVSVGSVTNVVKHDNNSKLNSTPGPNFEFNARIPGKMSGSPILVGGGILTKGVVSRSWQNENHASGCLIAPTLSLPINDGNSLLELQKSGSEGIAQIHGAGL